MKIIDVKKNSEISMNQLINRFADENMHFILGEEHDRQAIQRNQAKLIEQIVIAKSRREMFTVGWEFFNYRAKDKIQENFDRVKSGELTGEAFLEKFKQPLNYAPIIQTIADLGGEFIGINETREVKAKVVDGGIEALNPSELPPNFQMGTAEYKERFKEVMGNHGDPAKLDNYFQAQCFTDSVMAYQFALQATSDFRFTVVGSFHSDFFDGYTKQLKAYSHETIVLFKFVENEEAAPESNRGPIADYLIISK